MAAALIGSLISAGAGLWGQHQAKKEAEKNKQFQIDQQNLAYEKSMPWSSQGPAGNVDFDPETKQMMQTLNPEYQAMMQGFLGSSSMANTELQKMMGDPYAMEQEQFKRFEALNANAYAQSRMQGEEAALATGRMGGTQGYYDKLATEDAINQSRLGGQMNAMQTGIGYRNMLSAEALGFGGAAQDISGMLLPQAKLGMMVGQGLNVDSNMEGIKQAGQDYTKQQNANTAGLMEKFQDYDWSDLKGLFGGGGGSQGGSQQTYSSMFDQKGYTPKL